MRIPMTYKEFQEIIDNCVYLPIRKIETKRLSPRRFLVIVTTPNGIKDTDIYCHSSHYITKESQTIHVISIVKYLIQSLYLQTVDAEFKYTSTKDKNLQNLKDVLNGPK